MNYLSDHARVDRLLAARGRHHTITVSSHGSVIRDLGPLKRPHRFLLPLEFLFTPEGRLTAMSPYLRGRWTLRGTGIRIQS